MDPRLNLPTPLTRRATLRRIGVTGAVLAAGSVAGRASAQESADLATHPLVGVWRVFTEPPDLLFGLAVYHPDGTMTFSTSTPYPSPDAPDTVNFQMPALGVWEATGERSAAMTGIHMESDEHGVYLGTLTFYATVEVNDSGDEYALEGAAEIADPAGAVTATFPTATHATRLTVQAAPELASPAP